jgi:cytochrome P450
MVQLVSQESTRLFLGPEMCRDAHWLQASVNYIQSFFMGIDLLDSWRPIFRPLVSKFSQTGKQIRSDLAEARQILSPFIADRQARKANGEKFNDLLQWFDDAARGAEYDAPLLILRSSMAAVHSTSDLLTKAIFEICTQPGLIDDIREEAIRVFKEHGLRQTAIQELRLTDSVLKETQRLKPLQTST